jgi:uncharacterized protein involved in outer membrane biogenesis
MTTWRLRWQRRLPWILAMLLLLWLLAWFVVPALVKSQIEKQGSALLGRDLRLVGLELSPRKLAITLAGLSIAAAPGSGSTQPQLQVERLYLDLDMRSILRLAPVVEAVEIDAPQVRLTHLADGRYDIDDLIQRFSSPPAEPDKGEPARFALFNLEVRNGEFSFDDRPVDRVHKVGAFTLTLPFLSNLPDDVQIKVEPRLAFVVDGSAFDIGGQTTPFADGRASEFQLHIDKFQLQPWWVYLPRQVPVRAEGGVVSADLTLRFEQRAQGDSHVLLQGGVQLADLALRDGGGAPLLEWGQLAVKLSDVRPLEQQVALESVQLDGLRVHVQRDAAGRLNLQRVAASAAPAASVPAESAAQAQAQASASSAAGAASAPQAPGGKAFKLSLQHFELNDARIEFDDAIPHPPVQSALEATRATLDGLRWPVEADARVTLQARLWTAGREVGQFQAEGTASDQHAKIVLALKGLQLAAAEPYLREFLRPRASAAIDADAEVDWAVGSEPRRALALTRLQVTDFDLSDRPAPGAENAAAAAKSARARKGKKAPTAPRPNSLARASLLEVTDLRADLLKRQVLVGSVRVQRPFVELARDAQGALNASAWRVDRAPPPAATPRPRFAIAPASAPTSAPGSAPAGPPEWRAELRDFKLQAGRLRFSDAALGPAVLDLDKLRLVVQGLAWPLTPGAAALRTEVSASLRHGGAGGNLGGTTAGAAASSLDWRGQVALSPAAIKGRLRVERFPVHVFEPYFDAALPVLLMSAEAGFRGTLDFRQSAHAWVGVLRGDGLLADVRVNARGVEQVPDNMRSAPGASDLLSWNALALSALSVELRAGGKPRVEIGELRLSDYFSRLEISEQGRLNLQNVAAAPAATGANAPPSVPSLAVAPAGPASASDTGFGSRLRDLPIDLVLGSAQLSNGRVDFNDRFVRPNYRAQLSELSGHIGRFDSTAQEPTTLQLNGRVAGTGLLDIGGSINPVSNPPTLDVKAKATDIELPGLTPYSAKYAGYPIERGKLSVDVAYKIDSQGKLDARNQIIVNQLTFGPKSDSPDATTLPVRLAVALLQDSNGVIDIDLPLTGSINDPQFSLFGLIVKVIGNLFTKIVTAPFSLLAGGGDGKDLSTIVFQPGSAALTASQQATVDKVAKALANRPALNLTVAGQANAQAEAAAMRRAALEQRIRDEQRRERARGSLGSGAATDAPLPALTSEQRTQIVKALYTQTELPDKPRNAVGLVQDLPLADMETRLAAAVPVDEAAARALAVQRARVVREAFIDKGLGSERLFLAEPNAKPATADNAPMQPQALLTVAPK